MQSFVLKKQTNKQKKEEKCFSSYYVMAHPYMMLVQDDVIVESQTVPLTPCSE